MEKWRRRRLNNLLKVTNSAFDGKQDNRGSSKNKSVEREASSGLVPWCSDDALLGRKWGALKVLEERSNMPGAAH